MGIYYSAIISQSGSFFMLGPIFQRELLTLPRSSQHYVARSAYLGILWILAVTAWQAVVGWEKSATLGETARFSLLLFQILTLFQLTILMFFAALSAANNITTEKDRRTFILLLMTDLKNYEIVLGKLFGSMLQLLLLLAGTLPVMLTLLFLGGVSGEQVLQSMLIMASTAFAAGSLGVLIALWRDRTFQALALTVLFIVLFLCVIQGLIVVSPLAESMGLQIPNGLIVRIQQSLNPFLALQSVLEPRFDENLRIAPAYLFTIAMAGLTLLINAISIGKLRVWNPSGEPIMQREVPDAETADDPKRAQAHAAPGALRDVWANPILWREIATRAYGRRPLLVKFAYFVVVFLVCYYSIGPILAGEVQSIWTAAYGLVPITILSLLLIAAQAVTSITTERDTGALNLLLVTDLSANEFIFGKLYGVAYNTKEYLLPPLLLVIFYAVYGYLAFPRTPTKNTEAALCILLGILILQGYTMVLGLHVALRTALSRIAIINTLGTVFFLSVGTLVCISLIRINQQFEYQWASFIFFLAAGIGGLWWVLAGERPSTALTLAAWACPLAMFYSVTNILIGRPGTRDTADPVLPVIVIGASFCFAIAAMLVPMLAEFDVAMGRTTSEAD